MRRWNLSSARPFLLNIEARTESSWHRLEYKRDLRALQRAADTADAQFELMKLVKFRRQGIFPPMRRAGTLLAIALVAAIGLISPPSVGTFAAARIDLELSDF